MPTSTALAKLREVITENLRVQRGADAVEYISVGTALQDARARQNHAIFARRGCGKTLLLHHSARSLRADLRSVYLNCEDFKKHSFPNVLIEILQSIFRELDRHLVGWFGKKKKSKKIIQDIVANLARLQSAADIHDENVRHKSGSETSVGLDASVDIDKIKLGVHGNAKDSSEIERSFKLHREKLQKLDLWLPELKENIRTFFSLSGTTKGLILQIDDLYHLRRTDQAFVVDYIHRLCKDLPIHFKIATLRHASTLYVDRDGQPIGAQERHDYQPINIDYSFSNFQQTMDQNLAILELFGQKAGFSKADIKGLFKGEDFRDLSWQLAACHETFYRFFCNS